MTKILKGFSMFIFVGFFVLLILIALVMPEALDKHLSQVIAFVATLTGLISVIWTQYNKSIEELNKQEQFSLEKKHQISKDTYQELFSTKINVYKKLYNELLSYKQRLAEIGREDYDIDDTGTIIPIKISEEEVNIKILILIFEIIEKNIFVISEGIEEKYVELFTEYKKKSIDFEWLLQNEISDGTEAREANDKLDKVFFLKHKEGIENIFKQIETEIKEMKKEIGFI